MGLKAFFFRRAVRRWCIEIRLHRELEKEVKRLVAELMDPNGNPLTRKLNELALELYVPEYRRVSDRMLREYVQRHKHSCVKWKIT